MSETSVRTQTVAIYVALGREHARATAHQLVELLHTTGREAAFCDDQEAVLGPTGDDASFRNADLLVTIGGDGTLLRGARIAAPRGLPLIGINTGRLGFLTELEGPEAPARLVEILDRGFAGIEERVALCARVNGGQPHFALNDVVVRRGANARMAPFGLSLDGEMVAHVPSDGVVVATPTGSTAYFLSLGGPIISPGVQALGIAALLPHTLFSRPLIVPVSAQIEILCDSEIVHGDLEADGQIAHHLAPGDRVAVEKYPKPVRFALARPRTFFSRLQEKLQWGVPIKRDH